MQLTTLMKKIILLLTVLFVSNANAQTVRTSIASGDFFNPTIWSPLGIPTNGDSLRINHNVVLSSDIYYSAGQIRINNGGSLTEDATPRNVWADGGSLLNYGMYNTHVLYVSGSGFVTNHGTITGVDSLLISTNFGNHGTASIGDFLILPTGNFVNTGSMNNADSMLVQGFFENWGTVTVYDLAFDFMSKLNNNGSITVTHNMHNQSDDFYNNSVIDVALDFSNCNTQTGFAAMHNNGVICFGNDFINCDQDTITGGGQYFVGGLSTNLGSFAGNMTFNTPSGGLTLNTGTIGPNVTFGSASCTASLNDHKVNLGIYPNPTTGVILTSAHNSEVVVMDLSGKYLKVVQTGDDGIVDISEFTTGVYLIKSEGFSTQRVIKQ